MKQILVMMAAVVLVGCGESVDESDKENPTVVFNDRALSDAVAMVFKKPAGKFLPPPKFTAAELKEINILNLNDTQITDAGVKELAKLQKLTMLSLNNTQISDAGLKELAKLQNLKWLKLSRTQITDAGLKELAKLQKLDILNLDGTQITDAGLKELAKLQKLDNLFLDGTKVTKEGVTELRKALPICTIYDGTDVFIPFDQFGYPADQD